LFGIPSDVTSHRQQNPAGIAGRIELQMLFLMKAGAGLPCVNACLRIFAGTAGYASVPLFTTFIIYRQACQGSGMNGLCFPSRLAVFPHHQHGKRLFSENRAGRERLCVA
jgi:hypothetical protein